MKPREFWIVPDPSNTWRNEPPYRVGGLIHVREVTGPDYKEIAESLLGALKSLVGYEPFQNTLDPHMASRAIEAARQRGMP